MNPQVLSTLVAIIGAFLHNALGQVPWMNMRSGMTGMNMGTGLGGMNWRGLNSGMNLRGLQTLNSAATNTGSTSNFASPTRTMATCVGRQPASTGGYNIIAVTIKDVQVNNNNQNMFPFMFNQRPTTELRAEVSIESRDIDGMFSLVISERARDERTCTTDGLGELEVGPAGNVNPLMGMFGMNQFGLNSERNNGILRDIDIRPGELKDLSISATSLPYNNVRSFAGHGVALCGVVTPVGEITVNTNQFGFPIGNLQQMNNAAVCEGEIPLCCKLGFDSTDAIPY